MLIGMELVRELIECVILTGRLKEHAPVSLLLIASPESGKTSVVLEKDCSAVVVLSDVTGRGLQELCKMRPEMSHIVINDLMAVQAHKQSVNKYAMSMIGAMTEEGIRATAFPGQVEVFTNGKRGVIACLTHLMAKDGRAWWHRTGLASRMLPFSFEHSTALNLKIKTMIDKGVLKGAHGKPDGVFKIPAAPIRVELREPQASEIRILADTISNKMKEEGYRRLKQFRALACGHALYRSWKQPRVIREDVKFLEKLLPYISYNRAKEI